MASSLTGYWDSTVEPLANLRNFRHRNDENMNARKKSKGELSRHYPRSSSSVARKVLTTPSRKAFEKANRSLQALNVNNDRDRKKKENLTSNPMIIGLHHEYYVRVKRLRKAKRGYTHKLFLRDSKIQGRGVFTESRIHRGSIVVEYVGEVIDKEEQERREKTGRKCFFAKYVSGLVIDATKGGNMSKYINHSCDPNCTLELLCFEDDTAAVVVSSLRTIFRGEELSLDYGFKDERPRKDLDPCYCRSLNCRGFINIITTYFTRRGGTSKH